MSLALFKMSTNTYLQRTFMTRKFVYCNPFV